MFGIVILAVYAVLMIGVTLMFTRKTTDAEGFMWRTGASARRLPP